MKERIDNITLIRELAASEGGVFTSALAQLFGISKYALSHAAKTGLIERVAHGAYRISTSLDDGYDTLRGLYKLTNPTKWTFERLHDFDGVAVVGATAACLHEIGDLQATPYSIAVPRRFNSRSAGVQYPVMKLKEEDVIWMNGLPVVRLETTFETMIGFHEDPSLLADCFVDAVRRHGASDFDANLLKEKIGEKKYDVLLNDAAAAIPDGYRIVPIDSSGHLAIIEKKDGRP